MSKFCSIKECEKFGYMKCGCLPQEVNLCQEHMQAHIAIGGMHSISDTFRQNAIESVKQLKDKALQTKAQAIEKWFELTQLIEKELSKVIERTNKWADDCDKLLEHLYSSDYNKLRNSEELASLIQENFFERAKYWVCPKFNQGMQKLRQSITNSLRQHFKTPNYFLTSSSGAFFVNDMFKKVTIQEDKNSKTIDLDSLTNSWQKVEAETPMPSKDCIRSFQKVETLYRERLKSLEQVHTLYKSKKKRPINFLIANFGLFLKLKGREDLCKWYTLDITLKNHHPQHKSLPGLEDEDPFLKLVESNLKVQKLLKENDRKALFKLRANFRDTYFECVTYVNFLEFLKKWDLKNAFDLLYLQYKSCPKKLMTGSDIKEAYFVMLLMITTRISAYLDQENLADTLESLEFLRSCVYFVEPKNRLIIQLESRIASFIDRLRDDAYQVFIPRFESAISEIKTQKRTYNPDPSKFSKSIKDIRNFMNGFKEYNWIENWKTGENPRLLPENYIELKKQLKGPQFAPWNKIANQVITKGTICKPSEFETLEKSRT